MNIYHLLGVPDLDADGFNPIGGKLKLYGKGGKAPKAPDYMALQQQDAQFQKDMAEYTTQVNRPNQITPFGSSTWTTDRTFDRAGYDAALASYNQAQQQLQQAQGNPISANMSPQQQNMMQNMDPRNAAFINQGTQQANAANPALVAPNPEDFWTGGDTWTQTTTLNPEDQRILDQQRALQIGLHGAQDATLARVNQQLSQGYDPSGLPARAEAMNLSSLPSMGTALNASGIRTPGELNIAGLPGMGTALDMSSLSPSAQALDVNSLSPAAQALNINSLSPSGQILNTGQLPGMADNLDINALPGMGQVYDPTMVTNQATEQIMARLNPQLDRDRERLRAQLANQGIAQDSPAYNEAIARFDRAANDARTQAALQGINLGIQQQGLQYNQQQGLRAGEAGLQQQLFNQQSNQRAAEAQLQQQQFNQAQNVRSIDAALQQQQFGQERNLRADDAALQQQLFNQMQGLRSADAQLQQQQFNQQQGLRSGEAALQQQLYNQQLGNANLGLSAQQQQFVQQQQLRNQEAQLQQQQFNQMGLQRQNAIAEDLAYRNLPLQELLALSTGQQVQNPAFPNFVQQSGVTAPSLTQAAMNQYTTDLNQYNANRAEASGLGGTLGTIAGAGLGFAFGNPMMGAQLGGGIGAGLFSDRRLKRDVERVGVADNGLNIYSYRYVGSETTHLGYMADEVQELFPEAVSTCEGFLTVDYSKVK